MLKVERPANKIDRVHEPKLGSDLSDAPSRALPVETAAQPTSVREVNSGDIEFVAFPKMARFAREIIVTEKIDGTNAQIWVGDDGSEIRAGSRSRWIRPGDDNFGFAAWVNANRDELLTLGPGRHFGEWWGSGIQRGYGLTKGEKRFSLFNVSRWGDSRPACCHVVPVLYRGPFDQGAVDSCLDGLATYGSNAAPGFMKPEGIVVFHTAGNVGFKRTIEKDDQPKSLSVSMSGCAQPIQHDARDGASHKDNGASQ